MNVKYITKNAITSVADVFLRIINQISPSIISSRNLRLTATRVCRVCESGSFDLPRRKMIRVTVEMIENRVDSNAISRRRRPMLNSDLRTEPARVTRIIISRRRRIYLKILFTPVIT